MNEPRAWMLQLDGVSEPCFLKNGEPSEAMIEAGIVGIGQPAHIAKSIFLAMIDQFERDQGCAT